MKDAREEVVAIVGTTPQAEGEAELSQAVSTIELQAGSIVIASQKDYENAAEFGRMLKRKSAEVASFFAPMKKAAHDAHKQVCDREKDMLTPLINAEKTVKKVMGAWAMEQDRLRKEEEERLRLLAKQEADRLLAEAVAAEKNGDTATAEAAIANAQVMDQAGRNITLDKAQVKTEGVSVGTDWEIISVDGSVVPTTINGIELRPVDMGAVMRLIRASKGKVEIPGITYKAVPKMSFRK